MQNKHWNKPYSKRAYDLIQGNIDKVNHTNNLYEKQENNMDYQIGNEVIAKSNDVDITCMGKIQGTVIDDGNIYYVVCNSLFLADEIKLLDTT